MFTKNSPENYSVIPAYEKYFLVTSSIELKNVYNFPNPFYEGTYFTFILSQVPDELKIKIYTVTGRLIKEIKVNDYELTNNLNKIYWDGRDEDGNLPANGIYFYKIIARKEDKSITAIQKLAIVR